MALSGFYGTMAVSPPKVVASFNRMPLHPPGRIDVVKRDADPQKMARKIKAFGLHLGAFKVGNNIFHKIVREAADKFPSLRRLLILGEEFFYRPKRGPEPRWMTDDIFK